MRVLFVVPENYRQVGGIYLPVKNYIKQLKGFGVECVLFLLPYKIKDVKNYKNAFVERLSSSDAVMVYGLNHAFIIKKWLNLSQFSGNKIALLIDCLVLEMASVIGMTKIGREQMLFRLKRILYFFKERECLKYYDNSVFVSLVDYNFVKEKYKRVVHGLHLIPNGVSLPKDKKETFFSRKLRIGCLTSFADETVYNDLIPLIDSIFPVIVEKNHNCELIVAGRGCPKELETYLQAKQNVRFLGFVEELGDFYNKIDVVATTVKKESGIINRILEAWSYSKPVVGYRRNFKAFPEAAEGVHFISADTPSEFAEVIGYLMNHPEKLSEIGKKGNDMVRKKYTWESSGQKLFSVLSTLN